MSVLFAAGIAGACILLAALFYVLVGMAERAIHHTLQMQVAEAAARAYDKGRRDEREHIMERLSGSDR